MTSYSRRQPERMERQRKLWIRRKTFSMQIEWQNKNEAKKMRWKDGERSASSWSFANDLFVNWLSYGLWHRDTVSYASGPKANMNASENRCQTSFPFFVFFGKKKTQKPQTKRWANQVWQMRWSDSVFNFIPHSVRTWSVNTASF